jgi:bacillithiol biosynthesis cysteine-adding enzyme BshC
VPASITYLSYSDTGYFSKLVTDYLQNDAKLKEFYTYHFNLEGISEAIQERKKYPVSRDVLVQTLNSQYKHLSTHENAINNIRLLANENTYTVCTAHQPNLLTGYLYFIYKIIHAIKLAEELKQLYPDKNFVPVYYMGTEDNDLEELGTFRYNKDKYTWDGDGQKGAVGRMGTKGLKGLLNELFKLFGPPGANCDALIKMLSEAYLQHKTIADATQFLVNELFGRYGLIILNPDEAVFKQAILPIIEDDLLNQTAYTIVSEQIKKLSAHYDTQAQPRPINLFYLDEQLRERIEQKADKWKVVGTNTEWNKNELIDELNLHPERFSPNVILRGLLQESILPDVAFIGGGAEVAYWLELKSLFHHYKVFYPVVCLRQSVLWINTQQAKLRMQLQLSLPDLFKEEATLIKEYIAKNSEVQWQTNGETADIEKILNGLRQKASTIDPTLKGSAEAVQTKIKYQLQVLEKKMLRAEKKKMQVQVLRINKLKNELFPDNSLQERVENFSFYFLQYGLSYFDTLKDSMRASMPQFMVIEKN